MGHPFVQALDEILLTTDDVDEVVEELRHDKIESLGRLQDVARRIERIQEKLAAA